MTDTDHSHHSNNKTTRAYFEGFLDVSGGNLFFSNNNIESRCHFFINNCDISLNGATYETGDISLNFQIHEKKGTDGSLSNPPSLNNNLYDQPTAPTIEPVKTKNPLRWFLGF